MQIFKSNETWNVKIYYTTIMTKETQKLKNEKYNCKARLYFAMI